MLTHIDQNQNPTMVNISEKGISTRMATAQTRLILPEELRQYFNGKELVLKKGPVFQTAIIAGTMAVKKTHEVIPFCHQLPIEGCKFEIELDDLTVTISCRVTTTYKTGVEMEALYGASVAALTIYDMCKAVSHNIMIEETKLVSKTGGKRTILDKPVYGLVLTGGKSSRMGEDKALINYKGEAHASYMHKMLSKYCDKVFLSTKKDQWKDTSLEKLPSLVDQYDGPIGGMLTAFEAHPEVNWVVVACDLVHLNEKTIETLLAHTTKEMATCFKNTEKGFPEALCAFYRPEARVLFWDAFKSGVTCPVKVLRNAPINLIDQTEGINLSNINTPEERHELH